MPAEKKKKLPKVRFVGFSEEWEAKPFSELYERSSEKNDGSFGVDKCISVASMQYKTDVKVSSEDYLKTYYTFRLGDIAFEGHCNKNFSYGRFVANDIGDGIVSHIFKVLRPIGEYDLSYWKYAIHNENILGPILKRTTTASTMMHDLVVKEFLRESILVPSLEEQAKIGAFFSQLDKLIALYQDKLTLLKTQKQTFLQLMFPKPGSNVPEVRFAGFSEQWERCHLGELLKYEQPQKYIVKDTKYDDDYPIPVLTAGQTFILGYTNEDFGIKKASKKAPVIIFDDFTTSSHLVDFNFKVKSSAMKFLTLIDESNDIYCIFHILRSVKYKPTTHERHWISKFSELIVYIPSPQEQAQIGAFFTALDSNLKLHQEKLEQLKALKQTMLKHMFA